MVYDRIDPAPWKFLWKSHFTHTLWNSSGYFYFFILFLLLHRFLQFHIFFSFVWLMQITSRFTKFQPKISINVNWTNGKVNLTTEEVYLQCEGYFVLFGCYFSCFARFHYWVAKCIAHYLNNMQWFQNWMRCCITISIISLVYSCQKKTTK